MRQTNGKIT